MRRRIYEIIEVSEDGDSLSTEDNIFNEFWAAISSIPTLIVDNSCL